MGELAVRKFAGIDFGYHSIQYSVYNEEKKEIEEERLLLPEGEGGQEGFIEGGIKALTGYMAENGISWEDFSNVNFSMEDASPGNREKLADLLPAQCRERFKPYVITRFRAFVEYVFHQERAMWDRNTLLLEYNDDRLSYILIDQIRRSKQKAYRAVINNLDLEEYEVKQGTAEQDLNFSRLMKRFLVRNPANIIFLTGDGFEGKWMKKTLNYLCAGRRVFLGQNLYANGAALAACSTIPMMDDGMILMDGPQMVTHTIGIVASEAGKARYVPITSIGREWYNTSGSVDIILDKSQRIEFFFHNTRENELEGSVCEITDLPKRAPKTSRMRVSVEFYSPDDGMITIKDLGFGDMVPGTGKITLFPFQLIT